MVRTTIGRSAATSLAGVAAPAHVTEAEFEGIYASHYRDVYRYVLALTRSPHDADDITAETFERAFRSWSSAAPEGRPLPWLLLTARRLCTDRWRRMQRLSRSMHGLRSREGHAARLERSEFWLWFDALCDALPERQREVLILRYQRDLTDADIGRVMGLTESGVRSLVARALESLRAHPELLP